MSQPPKAGRGIYHALSGLANRGPVNFFVLGRRPGLGYVAPFGGWRFASDGPLVSGRNCGLTGIRPLGLGGLRYREATCGKCRLIRIGLEEGTLPANMPAPK